MPYESHTKPILSPTTEAVRTDSVELSSAGIGDILAAMNAADAEVPAAIRPALPQIEAAVQAIVAAIEAGRHLIYVGAGTSGRLAVLDAAECPPTFHTPPELVRAIIAGGDTALRHAVEGAEDDADAGARDLQASGAGPGDVVVGVSASGRTPYVAGALQAARRLGAVTASIACVSGAELSALADLPIEAPVGPEIVAGSTRLRAGTATKLILNMLSTASMIRLGYTYRGWMVNVQPTNRKLTDRALRILSELTGVPAEKAIELLDQAGRSVPVAVAMHRRGVSREAAELLLKQARGRLDVVLEEKAAPGETV